MTSEGSGVARGARPRRVRGLCRGLTLFKSSSPRQTGFLFFPPGAGGGREVLTAGRVFGRPAALLVARLALRMLIEPALKHTSCQR